MRALDRFFDTDTADRLQDRMAEVLNHGDLPKWQAALDALPGVDTGWRINQGRLVAGEPADGPDALVGLLKAWIPWRKGPLMLGGVRIDTEWRSDWKWNRIAPHVDLVGKRVLDIGAGNGYFGWRMLDAGAASVLGCDPSVLFWMQFRVVCHFAGSAEHLLLPLKFEDLPEEADYDAAFSLGVLYHRKDPTAHLGRIRNQLAPGGTAIIETLIIHGDDDEELDPPDRYANMRNVHHLPTGARLLRWMKEAGFENARIVDVTTTTIREQRSTDWMPFHSLAQALTENGTRTIEGHPPPLRAVVVADC